MAVYGKAQWVAKNIIELDTFRATQITTSRLSIYAIKKKKKKTFAFVRSHIVSIK